jgi:DNA-binding NtrC family response regulator
MATDDTKLNILIVDDEAFIRLALSRLLNGHQVFQAASYDQAAAILQAKNIDVVITDNSMAGRNGVDVLRLSSQLQPRAKRIMLTGKPPKLVQPLLEEGLIQHYFPKLGNQSLKQLLDVINGR